MRIRRYDVLLYLLFIGVSVCCKADDGPHAKDGRFNAVAWFQNSAEYRLAARQAYRLATTQLHAGLADETWTADEKQAEAGGYQNKQPAVVLDLDETVLDNSAYSARGILQGTDFKPETWNDWVREEKAELIPGARKFLTYAANLGVKVFFITNRTDDVRGATLANLKSHRLPSDPQFLLTQNDQDGRPSDKISRREDVADQHRILLLIGDSMGDFCSEVETDDQSTRNQVAWDKEQQFGTRWILIPNPMYGSWKEALPDQPLRTLQKTTTASTATPTGTAATLGGPYDYKAGNEKKENFKRYADLELFHSGVRYLSLTLLVDSIEANSMDPHGEELQRYNYVIEKRNLDEWKIRVAIWRDDDKTVELLKGFKSDGPTPTEYGATPRLMINFYPEEPKDPKAPHRPETSPRWLDKDQTNGILDAMSKHFLLANGDTSSSKSPLQSYVAEKWGQTEVDYAGEIVVDVDERVYRINSNSGTYQPSSDFLEAAAGCFERVLGIAPQYVESSHPPTKRRYISATDSRLPQHVP